MSPEHFLDYEFDVVSGATSFEGALFRLTPKSDGHQLPAVRYRMNPLPIIIATGRTLTPCCADLLSVAWHVNLADRLAPRSAPGDRRLPDNRWSRRMALRVPVHDPEPWQAAVISGLLREYLGYLSDDYWDLVFVPRPSDSEMQGLLWADVPRQSSVNLFSGGMDSFLGTVDAARNLRNDGTVLAASVIASVHHRVLQSELLGGLRPL